MSGQKSFSQFQSFVAQAAIDFENHRKKHLSALRFSPWIALACLVVVYFIAYREKYGAFEYTLITAFWIPAAIFIITRPIFKYRGVNKRANMASTKQSEEFYDAQRKMARGELFGNFLSNYSLKDRTYSTLFSFFESYEFAPTGGISLVDVRNATILPPYQMYLREDFIVGTSNQMSVKIADTNIVQVKNGIKYSAFRGLIVLIDICDIKIKLRGNFSGRTVVISDTKKQTSQNLKKYEAMKKFPLPNKQLEESFEVYTTDTDEASKLLSTKLFDAITPLAISLSNASDQIEHWDNKIAHACDQLLDKVFDTRRADFEKSNNHALLDLTKSDEILNDDTSINDQVNMEFYDDKILITIPCKHDLFETNSLFEPAINEEDVKILYNLMQMIEGTTGIIKEYLDARHGN